MANLETQATEWEMKVQNASQKERLSLQPQIDRVIATLTARGAPVPNRLRRLNNSLKEEAIEDMFDNLPV